MTTIGFDLSRAEADAAIMRHLGPLGALRTEWITQRLSHERIVVPDLWGRLLDLELRGLVCRLDQRSPIRWMLTNTGRAALT